MGQFSTSVSVSGDGEHSVVIAGRDDAGNTVTRTIVIRYVSRVTMLLQVGNVNAYVNNVQQAIEAPPFISGGRVMIPLRFVSQMFKASVAWDSIFQMVTLTLNGKTIRVQVGNRRGDVGGKAVTLDVAPVLVKGTVYVPIRFISENFGALVTWDAKMQVVNIVYPKP
jgi:aromatic ring-cleaving dioxygenase